MTQRIVGYENGLVKIVHLTKNNDNILAHILFCPQNGGYLLVLKQCPMEMNEQIVDVIDNENSKIFAEYQVAQRLQYWAKWIFYQSGQNFLYGSPPVFPNPFLQGDLREVQWNKVLLKALSPVYPIILNDMIQNNLIFEHVAYLLSNSAKSLVGDLIISLLKKSFQENSEFLKAWRSSTCTSLNPFDRAVSR